MNFYGECRLGYARKQLRLFCEGGLQRRSICVGSAGGGKYGCPTCHMGVTANDGRGCLKGQILPAKLATQTKAHSG